MAEGFGHFPLPGLGQTFSTLTLVVWAESNPQLYDKGKRPKENPTFRGW
jgi:hypothetical protein